NNCPSMTLDGSGNTQSCPSDPGLVCVQGCFTDTSQAGNDAYFALSDCVQTNCEDPCYTNYDQTACGTCQQNNCSSELQACQ
ncbi:MAG: hypothetical protein J7M25_14540, partial [Deltaproteobacteria bacterium]|nr:hypothetical protein [Deltaproteobacteria bacterium]